MTLSTGLTDFHVLNKESSMRMSYLSNLHHNLTKLTNTSHMMDHQNHHRPLLDNLYLYFSWIIFAYLNNNGIMILSNLVSWTYQVTLNIKMPQKKPDTSIKVDGDSKLAGYQLQYLFNTSKQNIPLNTKLSVLVSLMSSYHGEGNAVHSHGLCSATSKNFF